MQFSCVSLSVALCSTRNGACLSQKFYIAMTSTIVGDVLMDEILEEESVIFYYSRIG